MWWGYKISFCRKVAIMLHSTPQAPSVLVSCSLTSLIHHSQIDQGGQKEKNFNQHLSNNVILTLTCCYLQIAIMMHPTVCRQSVLTVVKYWAHLEQTKMTCMTKFASEIIPTILSALSALFALSTKSFGVWWRLGLRHKLTENGNGLQQLLTYRYQGRIWNSISFEC